jgi:glycosyltransferase involved in cell wall biosynthesis
VKEKKASPTVVLMGRPKKATSSSCITQAFSIIKREIHDEKMRIIGDGYLREKLESSNVKDVTFYWYILNEKKYDLLRRTHLLLMPAIREG